jgi:hypothetical protein
MNSSAMDHQRTVCRALGKGGREVTNAMLYQALAAETQQARDLVRKRANDMVKRGELIRIAPGRYRYDRAAAPAREAEQVSRMWRTLRSSKPGFSIADLSRISGVEYSYACKYLTFLRGDGLVRPAGRDGNTNLYRLTAAARERQTAPLPPRPLRDPFETEREAAAELARLFICRDLYQPAAARDVVTQCRVILARFATAETVKEDSNG